MVLNVPKARYTKEAVRGRAEKVREHLLRTWGDRSCGMCDQKKWLIFVDAVIVASDPHRSGLYARAPTELPSAAIVCDHCGNTLFVNMKVAGITEDEL